MNDVKSLNHTAWDCKYHLVWMSKCRKKVLYGELRKYLGEMFRLLIQKYRQKIVEAVMKQTGLEYTIEIFPWARTYVNAQNQPNALIYSMSRLAKREKYFKWIGIITPCDYFVYTLKGRTDIDIKVLSDMKKYKIGITVGDERETYLLGEGFELEKMDRISGVDANLLNFQKLKSKRIDLWPVPNVVAYYIVKKAGDDPEKVLQKVFELSELSVGGYYLAASKQTSDEIIEKIRGTLRLFKKTPDYHQILKKWGAE